MILVWLLLILFAGGVAAWITGKWNPLVSRIVSLAAVSVDFLIISFSARVAMQEANG